MCVKQKLMHMYGLPKSSQRLCSRRGAIVSEGFSERNLNQRVGPRNGKHCSLSIRGGEQTNKACGF